MYKFNLKTSVNLLSGSPWKDQISLSILDLQEKGEIQMLYNKWWKPPNDMCVPEESGTGTKTNTLDFKNICKYNIILWYIFYIIPKFINVSVHLFRWSVRSTSSGTYYIDYGINI